MSSCLRPTTSATGMEIVGSEFAPSAHGVNKLPLEKHHVILGRYNHGKKVKALTPAVDVYKKVRSQIRRTKYLSSSEILHIKNSTSVLLREELVSEEAPPVSFWVDVNKAKYAGKLEELLQAHPQLRYCKDFDGEEVLFVQDHDDFFLKADIDTKRRKTPAATSCTTQGAAVMTITEESTSKLSTVSVAASESSDFNAMHDVTAESNCNNWRPSGTEASVVSVCSASACDRTVSTLSSNTPPVQASAMVPGSKRFQLEAGNASSLNIELEVDQICCRWICECPDLEGIKRKTALVEEFKSYLMHYQKLLSGKGPLQSSPVMALRHLNQALLAQAANMLGNSMIDWFDKYPSSCLPGEPNAWVEKLQHQQTSSSEQQQVDGSTMMPMMMMQVDSDNGGMEDASVGTYEGSVEDMQAALSDDDQVTLASHYLSTFSLNSDNPHERAATGEWQFSGIVNDGEQIGERISLAEWLGENHHGNNKDDQNVPYNTTSAHAEDLKDATMDAPMVAIGPRAEWSPVCRDREHDRAMQDADQTQKLKDAPEGTKVRSSTQKRPSQHSLRERIGRFQRYQNKLRNRSLEKKRKTGSGGRPPSPHSQQATCKNNSSTSRNRSSSPETDRWDQQAYQDQSTITSEAQLTILCRRLRHNDPTLKQVRIVGDLACSKAMELTQALGPNFYDWDLRPVWQNSANRNDKPSYMVLKQIEPTLWEDSNR